MRESWVRSLGWEDPLEKGMATHSSIHTWRIPRTEEPGGLRSTGSQRVGHDWASDLIDLSSPQCRPRTLECPACTAQPQKTPRQNYFSPQAQLTLCFTSTEASYGRRHVNHSGLCWRNWSHASTWKKFTKGSHPEMAEGEGIRKRKRKGAGTKVDFRADKKGGRGGRTAGCPVAMFPSVLRAA